MSIEHMFALEGGLCYAGGMSQGQFRLKPKQLIVIEKLLAGHTQQEAAEAAGVQRETVSRWCREHPAFIARLNRGQERLYEESLLELVAARREAIRALRQIVRGEVETTPWERTRAIQMILNHAPRPQGETDAHEVAKRLPVPRRNRVRAMLAEMHRATETPSLLGSGRDEWGEG